MTSRRRTMPCVSAFVLKGHLLVYPSHFPQLITFDPTGEHEQRAVIDPQSISDPQVIKLQRILVDWINDELAEQRIIVQHLEEDMYDGQVLHKLWEKLTGKKLDVPEVTQSEQGQHEKLNIVLKAVNHVSSSSLCFAGFKNRSYQHLIIYPFLKSNRIIFIRFTINIPFSRDIRINFILAHTHRHSAFTKRFPSGRWPACTRRTLWPYYICWWHWCVTSGRPFACQRTCS